ncbi:2-hydroxyacyl-CoA dehydratase subunit D [Calderihabitans maritimus]|uniref:Benzoyl-CoA reductase, gamma subunit n=1 Tax=Calderihabitans maritimus TaxID=1246530 RepID=A0A1Z5HN77_9FIRM|nr:2-hydroxyacyl-CoA dehydratase family protein [Calderihabitans maritimus]GAW90973.1 benzoyl-CoA reductase, gamma subunit [Calderihabitans maritimus]
MVYNTTGRPFLGYFCSYVPVEIITAAGFVPYRLTGDKKATTLAYSYVPPNCCSFQRSVLERALRGDFDFLTGIVIPQTCDVMREIFDVWEEYTSYAFYHRLAVPLRVNTPAAVDFFEEELVKLTTALSKISPRKITGETLREAIVTHNRQRQLLQKIAKTRSFSTGLSGREFMELLFRTFRTPPEKSISQLETVLNSVPAEQAEEAEKLRFMVLGSVIDNPEIISLLENGSGMIVADDLCYGRRFYRLQVDTREEPLKALATTYLRKINCPCKFPGERRWEAILEEAQRVSVDGMVFLLQKFCDTHRFEQPDLERKLTASGYPVLVLEIENQTAPETLSTRVQAFTEMLATRRSITGRKERG